MGIGTRDPRAARAAGLVLSVWMVAVGEAAAHAATVVVSDCTNGAMLTKFNRRTVIDLPRDDVVIRCPLVPLAGTERVEVVAHSLVVDGTNGGSVSAGGKGHSVALEAVGSTPAGGRSIVIDAADLVAPNTNGKITLRAPAAIEVTNTELRTGGDLFVTCTGPACPVTVDGGSLHANRLRIVAEGTVTLVGTAIDMRGPNDAIAIVSHAGDVVLAVATSGSPIGTCIMDLMNRCPGAGCPLPITIRTVDEAKALCGDCLAVGNKIDATVEGKLTIEAPRGAVDVSRATIHVGESVVLQALTEVDMTEATIDNCGPKRGVFVVTAASCQVAAATLLDDEPEVAPTLACAVHGVATLLGTCTSRR